MRKRAWKTKLKKACVALGTYKPQFDHAIDELAGYLEIRDSAWEEYERDEDGLTVEVTNKSGATSRARNPLISLWDDMNKASLTLMRELGLTPAGLKKINEETFVKAREEKNKNTLLELLDAKRQAKGKDG